MGFSPSASRSDAAVQICCCWDFAGAVRQQANITYDYPLPDQIFGFLDEAMTSILDTLDPLMRKRVCGIGIGAPFELWRWHDLAGAPAAKFRSWKDINFAKEVAHFSDLPVFALNDATAACQAEHLYGEDKSFEDYALFLYRLFHWWRSGDQQHGVRRSSGQRRSPRVDAQHRPLG